MATGPYIALVPSPLTGELFWNPVHDWLWAHGRRAHLSRLPAPQYINPPYWMTHSASVAALLPDTDVVLVGHSGAGVLLPAIGRFAHNRDGNCRVCGYVFVDCDLPADGVSRFDLFDTPDLVEQWRASATSGWLRTWRDADLQPFITDEQARATFVAQLPRVPLSMYDELINVPEDWPEAPCAYLSLSSGYPRAVAAALQHGWPQRQLDTQHFAPYGAPAGAAQALVELIDELAAVTQAPTR